MTTSFIHARCRRAVTRGLSLIVVAAGTVAVSSASSVASASLAQTGSAAPAFVEPATPDLIEAAVERSEITEARGALILSYAFTRPAKVPPAFRSTTPWSGTLPLIELRETLRRLGGARSVSRARRALRATTFDCLRYSANKPKARLTSHFYIQYKASALRRLTIRQYAAALESSWRAEVTRFGWARPPKDPVSYPRGARYPVRIENLGLGLYGFVAGTHFAAGGNNPATSWNDRDAVASCMVLNQSYGPFPGTAKDALRATAAHEFNHSIQFGYGALTGFGTVDSVFVEGGATWMEDEVFDSSNDSYNYLWPELARPMGTYEASPYPYWVVFRAMTERFGDGRSNGAEQIMEIFWEQISKEQSTNLEALERGFQAKGTSLAEAFHNAAIALRFLRDCDTTLRRYCLEEGPDYQRRAGPNDDTFDMFLTDTRNRQIANNFAINWVGIPEQLVTIDVTKGGGQGILEVSIACRIGSTVTVTNVGTATQASPAVQALNYPGTACTEVSVVISNVKMTKASPTSVTSTDYTISTSP